MSLAWGNGDNGDENGVCELAPDHGCFTLPDGTCIGDCTLHAPIDYKHEIHKVSLFNRIRYSDVVGDIRYYVRKAAHKLFTVVNHWLIFNL